MTTEHKFVPRIVLYPGQVLIRDGEIGNSCAYFVQSGMLGVFKQVGTQEVMLGTLSRNAIVGEMALLTDSPRSATVRCLETSTVVSLNRETFEKKLAQIDPFIRGLLEIFADKIRKMNEELCNSESRAYALHHKNMEMEANAHANERADASTLPPPNIRGLGEGKDKFMRTQFEFVRMYHPKYTGDIKESKNVLTRYQVFREFWEILEKIDSGRMPPLS
ncbi:hypothetical protein CCP2SC5_540009 [Azospirillaceae bacterium]